MSILGNDRSTWNGHSMTCDSQGVEGRCNPEKRCISGIRPTNVEYNCRKYSEKHGAHNIKIYISECEMLRQYDIWQLEIRLFWLVCLCFSKSYEITRHYGSGWEMNQNGWLSQGSGTDKNWYHKAPKREVRVRPGFSFKDGLLYFWIRQFPSSGHYWQSGPNS